MLWFQPLADAGYGPDWIMNLTFERGDESALGAVFRAAKPQGFRYHHAIEQPCALHAQHCTYDLYVDHHHYEQIVGDLENQNQANVYIFHTLQLCGNQCQIVRGYGGYDNDYGAAETKVIHALADPPHLTLTTWNVMYGGMGYPYTVFAQGNDAASLQVYLGASNESERQ